MKVNKKLGLILKFITFAFLSYSAFQFNLKNQKTFAQNNGNSIKFTDSEVNEMVESNLPEFFDKFMIGSNCADCNKKILIIAPSGGNALDDDYKFQGRKMNDFVFMVASEVSKYLDPEKYILVLVNGPDNTIPEAHEHKFHFTIFPEIPTVDGVCYDHYVSATNQVTAIKTFMNEICEVKGFQVDEVEIEDKNDENKKNKQNDSNVNNETNSNGNENFEEKKEPKIEKFFKLPSYEPAISFISLQVNSNDKHTSEGMHVFYHPDDKLGKDLCTKIMKNCKYLISKNSKLNEENGITEAPNKIMTQLGKIGIACSLVFIEYCDNPKTQYKLFNKSIRELEGMNIANAVEHFFNTNPNYAGISFENCKENDKNKILIKINLTGEKVTNLNKIIVEVKQSTDEKNNFKKEVAVEHNQDGHIAYVKFNIPENLNLNDAHDIFYLKTFYLNNNEEENDDSKTKTNEDSEIEASDQNQSENSNFNEKLTTIPSNVTSFKITNENNTIKIETNEI